MAASSSGEVAQRKVSRMGLDPRVAQRLEGKRWTTAKDVLCRSDLELIEELNMTADVIARSVERVSVHVAPKGRTVLEMYMEQSKKSERRRFLPTRLLGLDQALLGGIPAGAVTELVGPAGIGKTQFCLMMCVSATVEAEETGSGDSGVVYIDTESKFSSRRLVEIAESLHPQIFRNSSNNNNNNHDAIRRLTSNVLVVSPTSSEDLMARLKGMESVIIERRIRLLVLDSVAALVRSEFGQGSLIQRQELLGRQASRLKYLAESLNIPVIVTNQVMGGGWTKDAEVSHAGMSRDAGGGAGDGSGERQPTTVTAALGTKWAHAVNVRLVLESHMGLRLIKIAKSPMSPVVAFAYSITSSGIVLDGEPLRGSIGRNDSNMVIRNDHGTNFMNNI